MEDPRFKAHPSVQLPKGLVVPAVPSSPDGRSAWFRAIAADVQFATAQLAALGPRVDGLGQRFPSLLSGEDGAAELCRGQLSNEVVYHDDSLSGTIHEFMPLPFLLACLVNGRRLRIPNNQLIEWRPRLLAKAGLITLPEVRLRALSDDVTEYTRSAYEGVKLLFGCRWCVESGTQVPVPYSISFMETWCGITRSKAVSARDYLRRHVLKEVGTVPSGRPKQMQMFLPLEVTES